MVQDVLQVWFETPGKGFQDCLIVGIIDHHLYSVIVIGLLCSSLKPTVFLVGFSNECLFSFSYKCTAESYPDDLALLCCTMHLGDF